MHPRRWRAISDGSYERRLRKYLARLAHVCLVPIAARRGDAHERSGLPGPSRPAPSRRAPASGIALDIDARIAARGRRPRTRRRHRSPRSRVRQRDRRQAAPASRAIRKHGLGEPPTPGTSKMIAVVSVKCFEKRLRQLPVRADSVEQQQRRLRTAAVPDGDLEQLPVDRDCAAPRSPARAGSVSRWQASSVKDVSPRGRRKDRMAFVPQRRGRRNLLARARLQPIAPVEPPASLPLLGRGHERIRTGWIDRPDHEGGLRIGRRIEKALQDDRCSTGRRSSLRP